MKRFFRWMPGSSPGMKTRAQRPLLLLHGVSHPLAHGARQHVEIGAHEERFTLALAEIAVIRVDYGAHLDDTCIHGLDAQIAEIRVALLESRVEADDARDAFGRRVHQ